MDETDFEGSEVLEAMAAHDLLDEFWEAIDSDDFESAKRLMRRAGLNAEIIAIVLKKMEEADGQH
ncbi:MAG: hypothetical protein KDD39_16615 [Bdellovibrionales bacterium]|nr:hypothetical protein [Bdellovibrionales bacterium]